MKIFFSLLSALFLLTACSSKTPPTTDISNAKMALIKAEGKDAGVYAAKELTFIKTKYQKLQSLMQEERYDEAKFLAQEIQADARLLEVKSERVMLEKRAKTLQGEINVITKDFAEIKE